MLRLLMLILLISPLLVTSFNARAQVREETNLAIVYTNDRDQAASVLQMELKRVREALSALEAPVELMMPNTGDLSARQKTLEQAYASKDPTMSPDALHSELVDLTLDAQMYTMLFKLVLHYKQQRFDLTTRLTAYRSQVHQDMREPTGIAEAIAATHQELWREYDLHMSTFPTKVSRPIELPDEWEALPEITQTYVVECLQAAQALMESP